jgi:hypothetical protein
MITRRGSDNNATTPQQRPNHHQGPDEEADGNDGDQFKGEDNEGETTTTGRLEHENGDDRERMKGHQ